eukprot:scaffold4827_cov109-Isochrysis_galbana.AAC.19
MDASIASAVDTSIASARAAAAVATSAGAAGPSPGSRRWTSACPSRASHRSSTLTRARLGATW